MGPVLGLLIQPVELVGAALHVILQRVQVLLPLLGASLHRGTGTAQHRAPLCGAPKGAWAPQQGIHPSRRVIPPGSQRFLPAASGIWLGSRSCFPGGGARQGLGAVCGSDRGPRGQRDGGLGWKGDVAYGIWLIVKPELVCNAGLSGWEGVWAPTQTCRSTQDGETPSQGWPCRAAGTGELTLVPSLTMCGPMAMTSLWKMLCSSTWLLTSGRSVPKPLLLSASCGVSNGGMEDLRNPSWRWPWSWAWMGSVAAVWVKSAVLEGSHGKTSLGG